jgi:hypothetical protein
MGGGRDRGSWEDKSVANLDAPRYRAISASLNWITSVVFVVIYRRNDFHAR